MHAADLVVFEDAMRLADLFGGRQAIEALGLENAVDRMPVQVRQEVADDEGPRIERKRYRADTAKNRLIARVGRRFDAARSFGMIGLALWQSGGGREPAQEPISSLPQAGTGRASI